MDVWLSKYWLPTNIERCAEYIISTAVIVGVAFWDMGLQNRYSIFHI